VRTPSTSSSVRRIAPLTMPPAAPARVGPELIRIHPSLTSSPPLRAAGLDSERIADDRQLRHLRQADALSMGVPGSILWTHRIPEPMSFHAFHTCRRIVRR
jgi:hypothetical protein